MIALEHGEFRVVRVDPEHVDAALPIVREFLEQAVAHTSGFHSLDDLVATLRKGVRPFLLWIVTRRGEPVGAFFTTIEAAGDGGRLFNFEILAGVDAQEWIWPLVEKFEEYMAFMYGCTQARIVGRRGWERFLAQHGYAPSHFVTTKQIKPASPPPAMPRAGRPALQS